MLPYNNVIKYHETPAEFPMLHVDHSLTDAYISLSPSSQLMYEQEVTEQTTCGAAAQVQGLSISSATEGKSEDIISPSVEGMKFFDDFNQTEELFGSSPEHKITFGQRHTSQGMFGSIGQHVAYVNSGKHDGIGGIPVPRGMTFEGFVAPEEVFGIPVNGANRTKSEFGGRAGVYRVQSLQETTFENCGDTEHKTFVVPTMQGIKREDDEHSNTIFSPAFQDVTFADDAIFGSSDVFNKFRKQEDMFGSVDVEGRLTFEDCRKSDGVMNPTMERMTLDEKTLKELLSSCNEGGTNGNDWLEFEEDIYELSKSDCGLIADAILGDGPTLTQLNSDDLDSTLLDDFDVMTELYAQQLNDEKKTVEGKQTNPYRMVLVSNFLPVGCGNAVTSPKFTTCTMTSFTTSMSTSTSQQPQFSTYVVSEQPLFVKRETLSYPMSAGVIAGCLTTTDPSAIQMAQLMTSTMMPLTSATINGSRFLPVLMGGTQPAGLIGMLPGNVTTLSTSEVMEASGSTYKMATNWMSEEAETIESRGEMEEINSEKWWKDGIERSMNCRENQTQIVTKGKRKRMEQNDVSFNPMDEMIDVDLSEREDSVESGLEDSDMENDEIYHSDGDDSVNGKSEYLMSYATGCGKQKKKYFWQYNTQSKGPKGKRLCKSVETEDPHVLHDFEDPVFDPEQNQTRYKHNGKARRGDGNDVTPNPYKLYVTGNELKKLNRLINAITPSSDLPANVRSKMLKEKNKFSSRACRLKKKAQHEANKLKLYGLELEHRQLMTVLSNIKKEIVNRVENRKLSDDETLSNKLEMFIQEHLTQMIAGHTADFVNSILQKIVDGDRTGGINLDE